MEDRLQKLKEVIERGSFTDAAAALHISQPALSMAIKKLELELGQDLLDRTAGQLRPTKAGSLAYQAACQQQRTVSNLEAQLVELSKERPVVRIGMIDSLAAATADEGTVLERLEETADVVMVVDNSRRLLDDLRKTEIDIAFVVASDYDTTQIATLAKGRELLPLVCSPQHSMATSPTAQSSDFISYDVMSHTSEYVQESLREQSVIMLPRFFSTSPNVMLRLALAGRGVAALPHSLVGPSLRSGLLVPVSVHGEPVVCARPIVCVAQRTAHLYDPLRVFVDGVMEILAKQGKVEDRKED